MSFEHEIEEEEEIAHRQVVFDWNTWYGSSSFSEYKNTIKIQWLTEFWYGEWRLEIIERDIDEEFVKILTSSSRRSLRKSVREYVQVFIEEKYVFPTTHDRVRTKSTTLHYIVSYETCSKIDSQKFLQCNSRKTDKSELKTKRFRLHSISRNDVD